MNKEKTLKSRYVAIEYLSRLCILSHALHDPTQDAKMKAAFRTRYSRLFDEMTGLLADGLDHAARINPNLTSCDLTLQKYLECMIVNGKGASA